MSNLANSPRLKLLGYCPSPCSDGFCLAFGSLWKALLGREPLVQTSCGSSDLTVMCLQRPLCPFKACPRNGGAKHPASNPQLSFLPPSPQAGRGRFHASAAFQQYIFSVSLLPSGSNSHTTSSPGRCQVLGEKEWSKCRGTFLLLF